MAKTGDAVVPDTPHAQILLPVPGRSRDKPRSYSVWLDVSRDAAQDDCPVMSSPGPFAPPPSLFLPLTEEAAQGLAAGESLDDFLADATRAQLAALMLLI
nr:hypothetical protein [Tanacetum cinerariifolium]